jgi:hypothetical protein
MKEEIDLLLQKYELLKNTIELDILVSRFSRAEKKIKERQETVVIGYEFLELSKEMLQQEKYGDALYYSNVAKGYYKEANFESGFEHCQKIKEVVAAAFYSEIKDKAKEKGLEVTSHNAWSVIEEHSLQYARYQELSNCLENLTSILFSGSPDAYLNFKQFVKDSLQERKAKEDGEYLLANLENIMEWENWKGECRIDLQKAKSGYNYINNQDILGEYEEPLKLIQEKLSDMEKC